MKNKYFLALVVALLLCLAGWTQYAKAQRSNSMNQTWEYHVDPMPLVNWRLPIQPPDEQAALLNRFLNQRATEGWELAAVGSNYLYFKRPK